MYFCVFIADFQKVFTRKVRLNLNIPLGFSIAN